jgi:hypothetical protein
MTLLPVLQLVIRGPANYDSPTEFAGGFDQQMIFAQFANIGIRNLDMRWQGRHIATVSKSVRADPVEAISLADGANPQNNRPNLAVPGRVPIGQNGNCWL